MKKIQHILKVTPIVLAIGVLFSCQSNEIEEVLEYKSMENLPARSTTNVTYTFTDSGLVKNQLVAGKVEQFVTADSSYSKISNGFELDFFTATGNFDGKLTAMNAFIYDNNSIMVARDSVVFLNAEGETLRTEELYWKQDSAMVYTNKFVTIERETGVIYGKGLRANENFTNYDIKQPVGELYIEDERKEQRP